MAVQERAPTMDLKTPQELKIGTHGSKKRWLLAQKLVQSTVVRVRVGEDGGRQKGEGPPSDSWSWRKYGQKPIKGSPYPRGYYRCSTSKGCSAKKQVEKCRTDSSVLIITYTSSHNHPDPESIQCPSAPHTPSITQQPTIQTAQATVALQKPLTEETEKAQEQPGICDEEEPPIVSLPALNTCKKDDDGFFDELEELPISPSWIGSVRSSFFDEKGSSPIIDCAL